MLISHTLKKEFHCKINGLLKLGIKISNVYLKYETNVSEHKTK